jgi:hypothetical protein
MTIPTAAVVELNATLKSAKPVVGVHAFLSALVAQHATVQGIALRASATIVKPVP